MIIGTRTLLHDLRRSCSLIESGPLAGPLAGRSTLSGISSLVSFLITRGLEQLSEVYPK